MGYLSERAIADLRYKATEKFTKLPIPKLDTMHSGDNLSKLTNDIQLVKRFLDWDGYFLILRPLMAVATLAYLTYLNWQLTLASLVFIPIMMYLTMKITQPISNYSKALQEELANINKANQDILGGIQIVKSFNLKDRILESFKGQVDESVKRGRVIALRRAILAGISGFLTFLPFIVSFGLGSLLVNRGSMSVGGLLAFINLLNQLSWPLAQLPNHIGSYKAAGAGLDRIYEIVDIVSERQTGEKLDFESENVLSFNNVRFAYGEKDILQGISFHINCGEKVALVGPSGGGKSTIFKLITGFYQPYEGEISLFNNTIDKWKLDFLREEIAVVSQDTYLFPTTIKENITLGRNFSMEAIIAASQKANAHNFIMELADGYDTMVGERGAKLSGGQRQRISIARAILKDAKLLLLDEATSALDTESEQMVQQALEKAMEGRTTMVIAHRLSTIKNADRILVIEGGAVVEEGTHEQLLDKEGLYSKLYNKDFSHVDQESGVA
ncbi:ABC transporter ATP-binding protein [Alkalicella caledoniensis]|uniref:ABC transporter ATP-binding protein n=1 Tax=Alkalicella caledoniensis TaxID=2731377 RepID=A0A7G9W597_ALKCA|nr:ABC transporter ATP-binding protein [Alkalicella caledoniensis]QNO13859.1 ABC transporter ATP-binding protein [Alkalicella caledoniensis]